MEKTVKNSAIGVVFKESTNQLESKAQFTKYHTKGGHGFAAEDANAMYDRFHGKKVEMCGRDNSLNGADRIVDGVKIQTKYCQNANGSFNKAFDLVTGQYRYTGMKLEVPSDQYEEAVNIMRRQISNGEVIGITNIYTI